MVDATDADSRGPDQPGRFGPWALIALALVLAVAWPAAYLWSGRAITAPDWLTERVEARAAAAMGGPGRVELGSIVAVLADGRTPRVVLRDLTVRNALGAEVARIPELRARFALDSLTAGEVAMTRLTVVGADLTLRRDRFGRFDLALGTEGRALSGARSVRDLLDLIDRAFARPIFARLDTVRGEALRFTFQDARTSRIWRAEGGTVTLTQVREERRLEMGFTLRGASGSGAAAMNLALDAPRDGSDIGFSADLLNVTAADVASQVPALAFLTAVDAPLSAGLDGQLRQDGSLAALEGTLDIAAGAIRPEGGARPIPFENAHAAMSFDPERTRVTLTEITARTAEGRFTGSGHVLIDASDPDSGLPTSLLAQFSLQDIELNPSGELAEPARFDQGALDLRLTLSPFRIDLGQIAMVSAESTFRARGHVEAEPDGWAVTLDATLDRIAHDRLFALWPLRVVPRTREWLTANVTEGALHDVKAALRLRPGTEPRLSMGWEFRDGTVRVLKTLPPIVGATGHSTIEGQRYALVLDEGEVVAPNGERIDAAGSVFTVADVSKRPSIAEIRLETDSSIPAALALLDEPPLRFLSRAGRGTDLATGRARITSILRLPLVKNVKLEDVDFSVSGRLSGVRSETLVPGRVLSAPSLTIEAGEDRLTLAGRGRLGKAAFDATWSQELGRDAAGGSRVEGTLGLDDGFLEEFAIALPPGTVAGEGVGTFTLDLDRGGGRFSLVSDLNRIALSIPQIGWSKPAAGTGRLEVSGRLGQPFEIDALTLSAPGLEAEGRIELTGAGALEAVRLSRLRVGGWLDGPVEIVPRGPGRAPAVSVTGGTIDLRRADFGGVARTGEGGPVTLALDRLVVSEGIFFTGFRGNLTTQGGLSGRFDARLGGEAPVAGALAPSSEGTAIRLTSQDAGLVLRSSGLLSSARQGVLDLTLVPLPGQGRYDGRLRIEGLRLRGAPVLADLLGAISVVGLLEQLSGEGIVFGEVTGEFTLEPAGVTLRRGSAVGASLGVSMAGVYDLRSKTLDMQGTISPVYILNGIGQILTRPGEGLFGFNYRMSGPADAPRTTVNPLSILTPGMFREIFRAAPPRLDR